MSDQYQDHCNANYGPEDIPAPEMWVECPECCGEGSIEKGGEVVSRWSLDPPCALVVPCQACGGKGGEIIEAETIDLCATECQYAKDVAMPEHSCGGQCQYELAGRRYQQGTQPKESK